MGLLAYIGLFAVSLSVLLYASDKFIEAAEKIGLSFGISPFIIGVTIVAFGTSLPELATSIAAVFSGSSEIVVGNVIGSNITNILLVLGLTAIVGKQIKLDFDVMDIDMPLLICSAIFMFFALSDGDFTIFEALLFLACIPIFLLNSFKGDKVDKADRPFVKPVEYLILLLGGIFIFLGAKYTIVALEVISEIAGISPELIALTGIALGTSLPEVIVSIAAARKGKHAIAVGNVLGSNLFNTYAVMSIPRLIGDLTIPASILDFSLPFMVAVTFIFAVICLSKKISKWEGMMLVVLYIFFIYYLVKQGLT